MAFVIGVAAIMVGAADVATRASALVRNADLSFSAFAPAVLLLDPSLRGAVQGAEAEALVPLTLRVPSIGVDATVEKVGKKDDGSMGTPRQLANVAWYEPGVVPGEPGNAVFAGHVNNAFGQAGVFKKLSQVAVGDRVEVVGEGGQTYVYEVESLTEYLADNAPIEDIFAQQGPSKIALITCEGEWDPAARTYDKRLVVVAHLLNP